MTQLVGRNEGVEYVRGMVHQRESTGMEYPSDSNSRGNAKAVSNSENKSGNNYQRHAAGDVVEDEDKKAMGGMMGGRFGRPGMGFGGGRPMPGAMRKPMPAAAGAGAPPPESDAMKRGGSACRKSKRGM